MDIPYASTQIVRTVKHLLQSQVEIAYFNDWSWRYMRYMERVLAARSQSCLVQDPYNE